MALILRKAWQGYLILFEEVADPRTKSWPLVAKPYQGIAILSLYLMFVLKWGPQWMKNRKPYNLDKLLIVYNALQVVACVYIFVNAITLAWGNKYRWICEPVDTSNSPSALAIARMVYTYFLLKVIDLLDTVRWINYQTTFSPKGKAVYHSRFFSYLTPHVIDEEIIVNAREEFANSENEKNLGPNDPQAYPTDEAINKVFFVLRKKLNQISFLHIYHHTGMVLLIWGAVTYLPGGHGTLIGVINTFVHIVMYSYYLLTVAFPSIKNAIWFKKLVTQLQILQFFWCVVHMAIIVFKTDCEYPRWTSAVFLPQNLFMLVLFTDFYIKTYITKPKEKLLAQRKAKLNNYIIDNNNIPKNGINKLNNEISKLNEINNMKNILNKRVNGDDFIINNSDVNFNINGNGNAKLTCANGKSRMNCHAKQE